MSGWGEVPLVCTCGRTGRRPRRIELFELLDGAWTGEHCGALADGPTLPDAQHPEDVLPGGGHSRVFQRPGGAVWRGRCPTCSATGDRRGSVTLPVDALTALLDRWELAGGGRLDLFDMAHRPERLHAVVGHRG
ncbi:hypothetical protein [Actinosynnema pretiosum]|uniref:Uncharacterized protein n=1 Tax=Actinosynnema pretiosum TaxID=42197 RepID=A0A290YZC9_9PSEU|nr:hypothetical protein [Actinosynnema pretiosum]ATE52093.1 hypothetical protein CNX65_01315 [Actinosynnema pretiosum]